LEFGRPQWDATVQVNLSAGVMSMGTIIPVADL
jgi:hypothetical protein